MVISNFARVNQRLAFAGSLYALSADGTTTPESSAQQLRQQALLSSCCYQLQSAFHFYLREIADRIHLKNANRIDGLADLEASLIESDKACSDVAELRQLMMSETDNWLKSLMRYQVESLESPAKQKEPKSFHQDNLIAALDVTDEGVAVQLTAGNVGAWLSDFRALVLRQRDISAEF